MSIEKLEQIIHIISKGDTGAVELLFSKPGGRKYLESIVLIVVNNLPSSNQEKEVVFKAFIKGLNKIEKRIRQQKDGQKILSEIFS